MHSRSPAIPGLLLLLVASAIVDYLILSGMWSPPRSEASAALAPAPDNTRTYQFAARVTDNGGVTPFKVGDLITGTFTYDLDAKDVKPSPTSGLYKSARNAISFRLGDLTFFGAGEVIATTASGDGIDHFGVLARDLKLPESWDMEHSRQSLGYFIMLRNDPAKGVFPNDKLPERLDLSKFSTFRQLRFEFYKGVRFPGGEVKERTSVYAVVETLDPTFKP